MSEPKSDALPPAAYVNFLRISQQASEFFFAFGQLNQQEQGAHLVSCLVTTPAHAKSMLRALSESIRAHEERFGAISEPPVAKELAATPPRRRPAPPAPRRPRDESRDRPAKGEGEKQP